MMSAIQSMLKLLMLVLFNTSKTHFDEPPLTSNNILVGVYNSMTQSFNYLLIWVAFSYALEESENWTNEENCI